MLYHKQEIHAAHAAVSLNLQLSHLWTQRSILPLFVCLLASLPNLVFKMSFAACLYLLWKGCACWKALSSPHCVVSFVYSNLIISYISYWELNKFQVFRSSDYQQLGFLCFAVGSKREKIPLSDASRWRKLNTSRKNFHWSLERGFVPFWQFGLFPRIVKRKESK